LIISVAIQLHTSFQTNMGFESKFSSTLKVFHIFGIERSLRWTYRIGFASNVGLTIIVLTLVVNNKFALFATPWGVDSGFVSDIIKFAILYVVTIGLWLDTYVLGLRKMANVIANLTDIDSLMVSALRIDIDDHYDKQTWVFFAKLFATLVLFFSSTVYLTKTASYEIVFVFQYPNFFLILKILQSILHVSVLRCRLKIVNRSLEELVTQFGYCARLKNRKYRKFLVAKLKVLIHLFDLIYDQADLLNQYFGYPMYRIIESNNVQMTSALYWTTHCAYNCGKVDYCISEYYC
jgi:7tm Chemosensory receptor